MRFRSVGRVLVYHAQSPRLTVGEHWINRVQWGTPIIPVLGRGEEDQEAE